jgi:hypothetical protein
VTRTTRPKKATTAAQNRQNARSRARRSTSYGSGGSGRRPLAYRPRPLAQPLAPWLVRRSPVGASWRRRRPSGAASSSPSPCRGDFVPVSCSGLSLPESLGGERETGATRRHETATPETARARRGRREGGGKGVGTERTVRAGSFRAGGQAPAFAHVAT